MKKPYQPPAIEVYPSIPPDFLTSSGLPVGEDPETGFGEIKFFSGF